MTPPKPPGTAKGMKWFLSQSPEVQRAIRTRGGAKNTRRCRWTSEQARAARAVANENLWRRLGRKQGRPYPPPEPADEG